MVLEVAIPVSRFRSTGQTRPCVLRMSRYIASITFTGRCNEIIKDVPRKVKVVDYILLYDQDMETAFYHTQK